MRRLLILALLCQGLFAANPSPCKNYTAQTAADEAAFLINQLHHHGYKFKLDSFTEEPSAPEQPSCLTVLALTLNETKCHIVNPKPFNECEVRERWGTPVTAKCNVTFCDGEEKPGIAHLTCDTEPASSRQLIRMCPDCPTLLPLHDHQGLESVKAAIEKFNDVSEQTSIFKLLEVGRLSTQYNMMFGMTQFAEFAIVETECSDNVENKERPACKQKCPNEAHHGFCKSTQLGNGELTVNCEIYDIQNTTQHSRPPFHHGKHCGHHERHPHRPGHHERGEHERRPGHHNGGEHERRPEHHKGGEHETRPGHHKGGEHETRPGHHKGGEHETRPGHHKGGEHETRPGHPKLPGQPGPEHASPVGPQGHQFCFTRTAKDSPFHRGPPHHAGPPHHKHHEKHDHDHMKPHPKPTRPPQQEMPGGQPTLLESEEVPEFSFPHCHGAVKIPPSIHPICPFPPPFHRRKHQ